MDLDDGTGRGRPRGGAEGAARTLRQKDRFRTNSGKQHCTNEAIRTADNPEATDADKRKAGEVFHEMEGNGLYEILMTGKPGIRNRILGLIDHYKSQTAVPTEGDREAVQDSPRNIPAVEGLDDFDIRDFV